MTPATTRLGGDSDHKPLRLRLSIDYSFVEPQHTIETKKFLPRLKYDKSKAYPNNESWKHVGY